MIRVTRRPGLDPARGLIRWGNRVWPCRLGKAGLTSRKREGDRATPQGVVSVVDGYVRSDRSRRRQLKGKKLRHISQLQGWCDDPHHPAYNLPVQLPFPASHEKLLRKDRLYDVVLVLDWNMPPSRSRGAGSAIFVHIAPEHPQSGTHGCIALEPRHLSQLLAIADTVPGPIKLTIG
ncbi:MAG: L,D-transpeptidase family protein [Pseudomonadota bacterium]